MRLKKFKVGISFFCITILLLSNEGTICSHLKSDNLKERLSEAPHRPKKIKYRSSWEKIVSFPGKLLYFPFKLTFKGTDALIATVDESNVIPRVNDVLKSDDGLRGLVPTYASRSGAGIKLYQKGLLNPESKLTLTLTAGLRNRQNYQLEFKRIRLYDDEGMVAKIEVGKSRDGFRFYLVLN